VIQLLEYDHGHNISEQKVNLLSNVQADIMGINAVVSYDRNTSLASLEEGMVKCSLCSSTVATE